MPKSIFEIEVDDRAFARFKKLFDAYDKALQQTPEAWREIDKIVDSTTNKLTDTREKLTQTEEGVNKVKEATDAWRRTAGVTDSVMGSIERRVGRIASRAKEVVLSFTRIATWTGIASGLLGAGSLWGLERTAARAGHLRRTTQGLGVGEGVVQSYQTNFQRFFDPRSVLENIASARNDPSQQWAFATMGLDHRSKTEDLAVEMPLRAKEIFAEGGQNVQYAQARGLLNFFSVEDLRRLQEMNEQEIRDAQRRYQSDQRQFRVSDEMLKKWQLLSVQLERSATVIESSFIRALSPLAPELEKLSDAFTQAIANIFTTDRLREVIQFAAEGIESAGRYLASEKFKSDLKEFGDSIERLWNTLSRVARWIGGLFPGSTTSSSLTSVSSYDRGNVFTSAPLYGSASQQSWVSRESFHRPMAPPAFSLGSVPGVDASGVDPWSWLTMGTGQRSGTQFGDIESRYRLPAGLLDRIWERESARGRHMTGPVTRSGERAQGHFQFMPATGAQYGLTRPEHFNDLGRSSEAAGQYMRDLLFQFRGDIRAAVAAYNWGPRRVNEAMRARGDRWEEMAPAETRDYLQRILGPRAPTQVQIRVDNQTGGSAIVTQNVTVAQ